MYDPLTVAFEIPNPFRKTRLITGVFYSPALITIWHKDPDDDECEWFINDRPWWRHPKYHFWHWKIQIEPLLHFKRWAFSMCSECGLGFKWGYSPIGKWSSTGPKWFKSEDVKHHHCNLTPKA